MGCRRMRLEKKKQLGGDCSNLEEDGGPDRTLCMDRKIWTFLRKLFIFWEKDRQKCDCGALEHSASVSFSTCNGVLEKVDVVDIKKVRMGLRYGQRIFYSFELDIVWKCLPSSHPLL